MSGEMREAADDETTAATDSTRAGHAGDGAARDGDGTRRRLFVMRTGASLYAVYANEVEATSENLTPTPLPFAPPPVRGVVGRRGRILTLIDPLPLLHAASPTNASTETAEPLAAPLAVPATREPAPFVVVLKGDEQLALSVESIERDIELYDEREGEPYDDETGVAAKTSSDPLVRRVIQHNARAVVLLDPAHLFDAAMRGVDRRRRRT